MTEMTSGGVANPEVPEGAEEETAFTMQDWLDSSTDFKTLRRGEVIEGTIMGIQRDGVIVDLGAKSEGVIPPHEMHSMGADPLSKVSVGEKILVYVTQPEADQGQVMLSVDRARGERGWRVLQTRFEEGEAFDGEVTGYNKGGLLVNVEGVHAFVPLSQVVGVRPDAEGEGGLASAVGKQLRLKVIEINRRRNRVILSERAALQEWRSQQKDRLLAELKEGEVRKGRVSSVRSFGVFIDLGGADGLAHLSEVSWDRNRSPEEMYKVGDEVDVYVMKVDPETKKIALSLRRAQPEQWDLIVDKYQQGRVVAGMVTKLVTFGAFARIEGPVEGLIHVSELVDRRIAHPKEVVREGDLLPLKIVRIERDRHRLGLSLRDAREEGTRMGFTFSDAGEVLTVPEDVRREFEEREGITVAVRTPEEIAEIAAAAQAAPEPAAADDRVEPEPERPRAAAAPAAPPPPPQEAPRSAMAEAFAAAEAAAAAAAQEDAPEAPATVETLAEASTATTDPTDEAVAAQDGVVEAAVEAAPAAAVSADDDAAAVEAAQPETSAPDDAAAVEAAPAAAVSADDDAAAVAAAPSAADDAAPVEAAADDASAEDAGDSDADAGTIPDPEAAAE
ncbi:MAG: S1 RNA-binding domain-containing protein [Chloroflexi bacterium]|nr:S1 RNA-binding domain-containing protein [Chloroflexota bacterium]